MSEFKSKIIRHAELDGRALSRAEVEAVKSEYSSWAANEITRLQAENEALRARVAELDNAAESEISLFMSVAIEICQQEADEWDSDRQQTLKNYAEACGQRISRLSPMSAKAFIMRKQAEAMEEAIDSSYGFTQMAGQLRTQAAELERQSEGGE